MTASGTGVSLGVGLESVHGTAQTVLVEFPTISRNINLKKDLLESQAVSSTRQRSDVRHGFNRVEGEIGVELRMTMYDSFLLSTLGGSAFQTPTTVSGVNLSIDATGGGAGSFITRASGSFIDQGYRQGDWVTTAGFTNAGNNGLFRVTSVANLVLNLVAASGTPFVTEVSAAGRSVTYKGSKANIGTNLTTFTIERKFDNVDAAETLDVYNTFTGCAINTASFSVRPEALATCTFSFIGMVGDIDRTTSIDANQTYAAPITHSNGLGSPPFAALDATAYIGGSSINCTAVDFTIDNQRSLLGVLGRRTSVDVYDGTAKVTGTISLLLQHEIHAGLFENETVQNQLTITFKELGSSEFLSITFYRVKFNSHEIDPQQNGPIIQTLAFEALEQPFTGAGATPIIYKEVMHIQRSGT